MQQLGISGRSPAQTLETARQDRDAATAPDLVGRNFAVVEPNRLWAADDVVVEVFDLGTDRVPLYSPAEPLGPHR